MTKINAGLCVSAARRSRSRRRAVHRGQDQPPDHRQPGRLPEVHRRDRRHRRHDRPGLLRHQRRNAERRLLAATCSPGTHHLNGSDALTLARTRENNCNPAENDLTRVKRQQQILNAIKGKLLSVGTFFRLPWASWDAPKVLRTDMGGLTLLTLFAGLGVRRLGSGERLLTSPSGNGSDLSASPGAVQRAVTKLMQG